MKKIADSDNFDKYAIKAYNPIVLHHKGVSYHKQTMVVTFSSYIDFKFSKTLLKSILKSMGICNTKSTSLNKKY